MTVTLQVCAATGLPKQLTAWVCGDSESWVFGNWGTHPGGASYPGTVVHVAAAGSVNRCSPPPRSCSLFVAFLFSTRIPPRTVRSERGGGGGSAQRGSNAFLSSCRAATGRTDTGLAPG